ncbi:MAG: sulfite exporter TauE/SafE family protein [Burkholderiaceae bacterium]
MPAAHRRGMTLGALLISAWLMGLAGGPHCIAMCGTACAGIGRMGAGGGSRHAAWQFQLGRVFGYAVLGAVAAASLDAIGWLSVRSASLRPVWVLFHAAVAAVGVTLLWQARQPVWLEQGARAVWQTLRSRVNMTSRPAPLLLGVLWAFMPCGLLYSALLFAMLAGSPGRGAAAMASFAVASGLVLLAAPWGLQQLRTRLGEQVGARLGGAALLASSGWALWAGLVERTAPWCVTPV